MGKCVTFAAWVVLLTANTVFAASICPVMTGGNAGGGAGVNAAYTAGSGVTNGGCNVLITFNANGSVATTSPNGASSYDNGLDDNLVGILNNTSTALFAVTLHGGSQPFAFETDGACDPTWTFAGGNPCGSVTSGYGHQGVTFSAISGDKSTGTVNFAGGIAANGGSGWFSLEGPVDLNLTVMPGVPEPGTFGTLGAGLLGLAFWARRRRSR